MAAKRSKRNDAEAPAGAAGGDDDLQRALSELGPEEAEMFMRALELAMKKRRILLAGYLIALVTLLGGTALALVAYASRDPGTFLAWVFLIPLAACGGVLMGFGKIARRVTQ